MMICFVPFIYENFGSFSVKVEAGKKLLSFLRLLISKHNSLGKFSGVERYLQRLMLVLCAFANNRLGKYFDINTSAERAQLRENL